LVRTVAVVINLKRPNYLKKYGTAFWPVNIVVWTEMVPCCLSSMLPSRIHTVALNKSNNVL